MVSNRVIFSDFDGVICDSIKECMLSSFNAYSNKHSKSKKIYSIDEINNATKEIFFKLRPYAKSGEEFLLIFWIIDNKIIINSAEDFFQLKEKKKELLVGYKKSLNDQRKHFLHNHKKLWLELNPIININEIMNGDLMLDKFYILTTKKKEYVQEILGYNGINILDDNIISTNADDKINKLIYVLNKNRINTRNAYFIDDHLQYLLEAKILGVNVYLADWGYISKSQEVDAKKNNISKIDLSSYLSLIKSIKSTVAK